MSDYKIAKTLRVVHVVQRSSYESADLAAGKGRRPMIKVRVADAFAFGGGFAVQVIDDEPGFARRILRMADEPSSYRWEPVPDGTAAAPSMVLPDEAGRALLDALTRHYQGAADMHTVRADLLHERGRVDKAIDALVRIASSTTRTQHDVNTPRSEEA